MRTMIVAGALALLLAGCSRGEKDETADLTPVRLTPEQRASVEADGIRPGMTFAQVTKTVLKRHPNADFDSRPSYKTVYYFGSPEAEQRDKVAIDMEDGLAPNPVYRVEVTRYFAKDAKLEPLLQSLRAKYGKLTQDIPKEEGVRPAYYMAGEGLDANGSIVRRCYEAYPPVECGLTIQITAPDNNGVVESASVKITDYRLKDAYTNRVVTLKEQAKANQQSEAFNSAEIVNAF